MPHKNLCYTVYLKQSNEKYMIDIGEATIRPSTCFMYSFMGVLWGHFSLSNSPGILAQGLDIHICVDEICFTFPPTT